MSSARVKVLAAGARVARGVAAVLALGVCAPALCAESPLRPPRVWGPLQALPSDGSAVIGYNAVVTAHSTDTLADIARRYGLGYDEIARANPGVDVWLPGEGTRIRLPGRHTLPPGVREGVVVDVAERRLYYFPTLRPGDTPRVITYPVSIGKLGASTPLGMTVITAKVEHPSWYPPAAVRRDHAVHGERLPAVVAPGPDNPLGDFMMRLGFGDGAYEIHGTNHPVSVGMAATNGCIGLYPEDIAALFAMVPVGTPVRLVKPPAAGGAGR